MDTYFSDHFSSDGSSRTTVDIQRRPDAGVSHGRLRYKRARVSAIATDEDVIRFCSMKSGDRIIELFLTSDGGSNAGAINLGLHKAGLSHDGDVIAADLFGSAVTISSAVARVDQFKESTTLEDGDRGKALWQLVGDGATYSVDPMETWDITATPSTTFTTTATELVLEVIYTAGD